MKRLIQMELLKGQELLRADETKVNAEEVLKDKDYVLFYFAAHWWPPCRKFTYKLKKFYKVIINQLKFCLLSCSE